MNYGQRAVIYDFKPKMENIGEISDKVEASFTIPLRRDEVDLIIPRFAVM